MNPIEFLKSCDKAFNEFNPVLKEMFPEMVTARVGYNNILQAKSSVYVDLISPWKVTRHNADINFSMMMHLTGNFGEVVEIDKFSLINLSIPRKFKYRKISGKTPYIVIEKLVKWLEKNRELILNTVN